jgi:hypothetical protein
MTPFGWADKPAEKHCWLICYERKILFRLKKKLKKTDYKPGEQTQCFSLTTNQHKPNFSETNRGVLWLQVRTSKVWTSFQFSPWIHEQELRIDACPRWFRSTQNWNQVDPTVNPFPSYSLLLYQTTPSASQKLLL